MPENDAGLQLSIAIIGDTGPAGHRRRLATENAIKRQFVWITLSEYFRLFVASCIQCLSTAGGETIPRPFGPALYGTEPNNLIQFDFIEMGVDKTREKYILMLRGDHSSYCWFYPAVMTSAETTALALLD